MEGLQEIMNRLKVSMQTSERKCRNCGKILSLEDLEKHKYERAWEYKQWEYTCFSCIEKRKLKYRQEHIEELMKKSNVALKYFNASTENLAVKKYQMIVKEYKDGGLFLWGNFGSGKTYVAICILRELLLKGKEVYICSIPELLLEIKDTFGGQYSDYSEKNIIEKYGEYSYLILDDLGAEKTSEWALQTLYLIIDRRDRFLKPTIFTSNLSLDQIKEKLSDRIASRIAGMCEVIKLNEEDLRLKLRTK